MKAFDKDGNEIDVFSKEELEEQVKAAAEKAIADAKAVADAERAAAEEAASKAQQNNDEVPAWAKAIMDKVETLSANHTKTFVERVASGLDADRRKLVETKFESLSAGYDDSPEGLARRAEDAYLLATGEKFNAGTVNMQNLAASGGGRSVTQDRAVTEVDQGIRSALGITPADAEKFGKK